MNNLKSELIAKEFELTKPEPPQLSWRDWVDSLNTDDLEKLQGALMKRFGKAIIENKRNGAVNYVLQYLSTLESQFLDWLDKSTFQVIDYQISLRCLVQSSPEEKWYWSKIHQQLWGFRGYSQNDDMPPILGIISLVSNSADTFLTIFNESLDKIFSEARKSLEQSELLIAHIESSRKYLGNKTIFDDQLSLLRNPASIKINIGPISTTPPSNLNFKSEGFYYSQVSKETTEESELVIGFDFGTSCTKAIVRDSSSGIAYVVPFEKFERNNQLYLIPTTLFIDHNGTFCLEHRESEINDIKIQLMNNPGAIVFNNNMTGYKVTALEASIAYVALVLREIRCWFFGLHSDKYRNTKILWQFNIGLPSRSYDDKVLHESFKLVALAGWNVSTQPEATRIQGSAMDSSALEYSVSSTISVKTVRQVLQASRIDLELLAENKFALFESWHIHPENVNAYPEVISEIVGYAKSSLRREGLHMLIDIGACTVDIAIFILHKESGNDSFALLTTEVEPYGAFMLHRNRLEKIKTIVDENFSHLIYAVDGMTPLPTFNDYMPSIEVLNSYSIDAEFIQKFKSLVKGVIEITRKDRDPHSGAWYLGLSVFFCGGGSQLEAYKDAIKVCSDNLTNTLHIAAFDIKNIPKPEGLEAQYLLAEHYHRVAVAYGLSYDSDNIGGVVPPSQIPNINDSKTIKNHGVKYIGPEMM